jgi:oxygen-independent coproporphyrinogen-3 oxidase
MQGLPAVPDSLGLYLHLPWCLKKCPYCDFNSHVAPEVLPERAYTEALLRDFDQAMAALPGRRIDSLFFGGGTPSLFSPESIARVIETIRASGLVADDVEITLEANPGAADSARFHGYRQAGVTRLSIGVQTFDDELLRRIGRVHDGQAARAAVSAAADCFRQFSIDLMYGLPGQTPAVARDDVKQALASGASHLSCYQLTLEPNTVFYSRPPMLPAEPIAEAIEDTVYSELLAAGFARYEVSNWCVDGQPCRHNLNYWRYGDYLGLGAGAHSKLTVDSGVVRQVRLRKPGSYARRVTDGGHIGEQREIDGPDLRFEFLLNALRLTEGFELARFERATGSARHEIAGPLRSCAERGLLRLESEKVRPTTLGQRFLNIILGEFLPESTDERQLVTERLHWAIAH